MHGSTTLSTGGTSPLVLVARLLLLLVAAALAATGFALAWGHDGGSAQVYACPMHPEVTSSEPAECTICRMALERVQVAKAPVSSTASSAPVSGAPGEPHHGGQASHPSAHAAHLGGRQLTGTAKRQLLTLDIRAPAWLEKDGTLAAILYKDEIGALSSDEHAQFFSSAQPDLGIPARLTAEPPAPWDGSTAKVHFRLDPAAASQLRPVEAGWVKLATRSRELLVIPSGALVSSAEGVHVLLPGEDGHTFIKRRVETGKVRSGHVVVLSGLAEAESIVVGNTFLAEAERRMKMQPETGGQVME
jgi:hypothetical protein